MTRVPEARPEFWLHELLDPPGPGAASTLVRGGPIERLACEVAGGARLVIDRFGGPGTASCCFFSHALGPGQTALFRLRGIYALEACPSGGWLLKPVDAQLPTYWIPQAPVARGFDALGRIVSESPCSLRAVTPAAAETALELAVRTKANLELAVWSLPAGTGLATSLEQPSALEAQPIFMWASHTALRGAGEVYRYIAHGSVYENRFDWRRKRKICSELEAYSLYVALRGLEAATHKTIYRLLRLQLVLSVVARQSADGGWKHGEWTDFMESHYRFHCGAMLLLESALEDLPEAAADGTIRRSLERAAALLSRCVDSTDIGTWFLHDSLEQSLELTEKSGMRWVPSRVLGKSVTNKMILNTHLDAIVALDRYRELTGDDRFATEIQSALLATRRLLALRPAEPLYRLLYRGVGLTLLPAEELSRLSAPLRIARRLTRRCVVPQLHRIKRRFPRMVMPGGLIERHLSRLHFGTNYHSVNVSDLARLRRRFFGEDFDAVLREGAAAVTGTSLLRYWVEAKEHQALGFWVEATYQLAMLHPEPGWRAHLAEAMLAALDAGLGLPPSLLGANPEVVPPEELVACPSPADPRLRIANLGRGGVVELLVVNPEAEPIPLAWEREPPDGLAFGSADGTPVADIASCSVPAHGWLLGSRR
ncbi:MAG TPA: hypothetical protein VMN79_04660 [Casimicrobiaceae bacterium]|nr:hypothetical protein [Casimicrobiaceae bacterium]